jgi:hypothetical protein
MEVQTQKQRNIIFITGILTTKWGPSKWKSELTEKCPNDKIFIIHQLYFYTQKKKIDRMMKRIENILKNQQDTILIGHSFGGIIAVSAYMKNIEQGNNVIRKIITMASPHGIKIFGLKEIKEYLGYKNAELDDVEIQTFGGFADPVVFDKNSKIKFKKHETLLSGHFGFLFSKKIIRKIIKYSF